VGNHPAKGTTSPFISYGSWPYCMASVTRNAIETLLRLLLCLSRPKDDYALMYSISHGWTILFLPRVQPVRFFTVKYFMMPRYLTILIPFLLILVRSDTTSLFDDENSSWDISALDSAPSALTSSDAGDEPNMGGLPDSISSSEPNWNFLPNGNNLDTGEPPQSIAANDQSLEWVATAGVSCGSIDDQGFQPRGLPRSRRRDGSCSAGVKPKTEDPSERPNSMPIEIPNTFTNRGGDPLGFFYPSENDNECPPSLYGNRKTPMCDSGFGEDFMRYSVLGFIALDMIKECLPCTDAVSSDSGQRAHWWEQGAPSSAAPIPGWPGAVNPTRWLTG
jgi:hypothetical protein